MSDNIPLDIQVHIIKRLPIKSVIQFRLVSKAWKSLIDSSNFIAGYRGQMQHLLVRYGDSREKEYVSIVDDDNFPQHRTPLTPPPFLKTCSIIGSSHGLLCFFDNCGSPFAKTQMAVLWNISIRKAIGVVLPNLYGTSGTTVLGFGVCRKTTDPKIVKISHSSSRNMEGISWQVEVFALSTGAWRSSHTNNPPRKSIQLVDIQRDIDELPYVLATVDIKGFLYGLATDRITIDGEDNSHFLMISFGLTSEEFGEINLPDRLAHTRHERNLGVAKLRESLVVLEHDITCDKDFVIWMMTDDVAKSFSKLFTISTPDAAIFRVHEFRKSGEAVLEILEYWRDGGDDPASLVVYEPHSKHMGSSVVTRIDGISSFSFALSAYTETLLLLDQPNSVIYGTS